MSNRELLQRIIEHDDRRAYSRFFHNLYAKLIKFAVYYVKGYQSAEDVVSDVFVYFLKNKKNFGEIKDVEAFFYIAVKNQSLKHLRKNGLAHQLNDHPEDFEIAAETTPFQKTLENEFFDVMNKAVEALPPKRRMVFRLVKEDGLKYAQVAELLDLSIKTVETHLALAVKSLREVACNYMQSKEVKTRRMPFYSIFL